MVHFNQDSFDKALAGGGLILADFWAGWCPPCRRLGPVMEELAEQYQGRALVGKVNTDEEPNLALRYGVSNIPTVIVFKNGRELCREVGAMDAGTYTRILDQNL